MSQPNLNLAQLSDDETARTDPECAAQRADHLDVLGVCSVLELCVGPSLRVLEAAYVRHGITVTGNDLDQRWQRYYPQGRWMIGDALAISWAGFDAVVFAAPVTRGCTGRRVDALQISQVQPSYAAFIARPYAGQRVMVLPARAYATAHDRRELHALLARIKGPYDTVALTSGRRQIRKYVDVYFKGQDP